MSKEYKINLFKDKTDYKIELTKDNVVNVIGTKGSGKTTLSKEYQNKKDYVIINCDDLINYSSENDYGKYLSEIIDILKNKDVNINESIFTNHYDEIINYLLKNKKKVFIEGNSIQDIEPITTLKGTIIIKRTAIVKAFFRAVNRDYHNEYFMKLEKEKHGKFAKFTRLYKVIKRRKNIFYQYKDIENKIKELEEYKIKRR